MKVGIVIPSFNQGKYIEKAIKSVLDNRQHCNIEIAIVDGGSNDETVEIIKKYEKEVSFWCSEADKGQADAINKGIEALPSCDYYMWLNSDDVYEDEYAVAQIVNFAKDKQYEVCYGLSHFIDEYGEIIGEYPTEEFSYENLGKRCYISQPSVIFSRKAYEEIGKINVDLYMCLDYEYWIRLAQKYKFGFIRKYIGCTRMYGSTKTSTMQLIHLEEAICVLKKYYDHVPMRWVLAYFLAERGKGFYEIIPKRLILLMLIPFRKQIVNKIVKREEYV